MTAKEKLRARVEELSEEEAAARYGSSTVLRTR
jgi:hypothetical protein